MSNSKVELCFGRNPAILSLQMNHSEGFDKTNNVLRNVCKHVKRRKEDQTAINQRLFCLPAISLASSPSLQGNRFSISNSVWEKHSSGT